MPKETKQPVYVGGDDPETIAKRQAYEQALDRLSKSLETRQQRMFDPALLKMGMAFLDPGKTGSFWEAAGRAAGAYSEGEEQKIKEEQDIARAQMEAAGMGLELQRQKQGDIALEQFLKGKAAPAGEFKGAAGESPVGPLSQVGQYGIQIMPPRPGMMTGADFMEVNRGRMAPQELLMKAQEIDQKNLKVTEAGALDQATGMFYPSPKGELVERNVYGYGEKGQPQTVKVPQSTAFLLDSLAAAGDPRYYDLVQQIQSGPPRKKPEAPAISKGEKLEVGIAEEPKLPSKTEAEIAAKAGEKLEVGRVESALKAEEQQPAKAEAAQRAFAAAADTERIVQKNPNAFGRLKQQGIIPGVLNLVSQGVQTPGGSINIKQLDEFVVQTTGKKGDLMDRQMAARNMAELVLAYRRQYFSGYGGGAISDMEQNIVNQLAARPEDDPNTILGIMKLVKLRSQNDINENRRWLEFKRANKKASYNEFIGSDDYIRRQDAFNQKLGQIFGIEPAIPSEQKAGGKFAPEQVNKARQRVLQIWGQ